MSSSWVYIEYRSDIKTIDKDSDKMLMQGAKPQPRRQKLGNHALPDKSRFAARTAESRARQGAGGMSSPTKGVSDFTPRKILLVYSEIGAFSDIL
jgi:hypothetical protein